MSTRERGIVTPEAVLLEFDTAGVGSRILARLVDLVVLMVAATLLGYLMIAIAFAVPQAAVIVSILMVALLVIGYPAITETVMKGRTFGKALLGLRVVTVEGAPIRFQHALLRAIIGLVEVFATMGGIAVTAAVVTSRSQRMGDLAAGTMVIRDRPAERLAEAMAFPPQLGWESYTASLDVSAVDDVQYGLIRSFLLRVNDLSPGARANLAVRLANPTALRMNHVPPPALSAELFLACVATAYQVRHGGLLVPVWGFGMPSYQSAAHGQPDPPAATPAVGGSHQDPSGYPRWPATPVA